MRLSKAKEIIKEVREQYNTIAKEWDLSRQVPTGIKMKQIKRLKSGKTLLDLGCGNGLIAAEVVKRGVLYRGIDISRALIKIARQKYFEEIAQKKMEFLVGDACKKLPYKENSFDYVFSFAVLHHVPGEEKRQYFFKEIKRVLKSGGRAVLINWNLLNDWPMQRYGIAEQIKKPQIGLEKNDFVVGWRSTPGKDVKRYIHSFSKQELFDLAQSAGFGKIKIEYFDRAGEKVENGEEILLEITK